ncbi:MAG TPA: sulfatase-like hydrolase/transferase [Thermoleophilaceae bacterium]|nr:sulfatase-like hydrolase/transferase [Thermoleophilaceae bacterium]
MASAASAPASAAEPSRPPVVVLVLDEFPTDSLTGPDGRIDAGRFPGFAALARDSTWFRNAWSIYDSTPHAVPAILTGKVPTAARRPSWRQHPQSLFSVLARHGYAMQAFEEASQVCPPRLCPRTGTYGRTFQNVLFRRPERLRRTIASIRPRRRPTLYFHHSLLPHVPWSFGPSGRGRQGFGPDTLPDVSAPAGFGDAFLTDHNQQRHLLQVGFVDHELRRLLARLRATGLYRRALVVVTADHGISFARGTRDRRTATAANLHEVAPVPLFVKLPGSERGAVSRSYASTVDVLPTIAGALGIRPRLPVDGHSAFGAEVAARTGVSMVRRDFSGRIRLGAAAMERRRRRERARRAVVFGTGSWPRLFAIGPRPELIGRTVDSLPRTAPGPERARFAAPHGLGAVDHLAATLPTWVAGRISFPAAGGSRELAVAVRGTVRAVGRSFRLAGDPREYFSLVYPESALKSGPNEVALYEVKGELPVLTPLGSAR